MLDMKSIVRDANEVYWEQVEAEREAKQDRELEKIHLFFRERIRRASELTEDYFDTENVESAAEQLEEILCFEKDQDILKIKNNLEKALLLFKQYENLILLCREDMKKNSWFK